jgi:hypothetical protein
MANTETMSLHELQLAPYRSSSDGQIDRQHELDKKRVMALVGSALSQLPIWGESPAIFMALSLHPQVSR